MTETEVKITCVFIILIFIFLYGWSFYIDFTKKEKEKMLEKLQNIADKKKYDLKVATKRKMEKLYLSGFELLKINKEAGVEILSKAAEMGHAGAKWRLGMAFLNGEGIAQNNRFAFKLFKSVIEQYNETDEYEIYARYQLASCYENGIGTVLNLNKAFNLYNSNQKHTESQYCLGLFYEFGKGDIDYDLEMALKWYSNAAAQGHEKALERINETFQAPSESPISESDIDKKQSKSLEFRIKYEKE